MPQVETQQQSGEMARRFIEFVLMHAQNAAFFLGQTPDPQSGETRVNLDMARIFIDQLEAIQEKTRGNLSKDEEDVLNSTLTNLRMAYVNARSGGAGASGGGSGREAAPAGDSPAADARPSARPSAADPDSESPGAPAPGEPESKKKFTKSYGP